MSASHSRGSHSDRGSVHSSHERKEQDQMLTPSSAGATAGRHMSEDATRNTDKKNSLSSSSPDSKSEMVNFSLSTPSSSPFFSRRHESELSTLTKNTFAEEDASNNYKLCPPFQPVDTSNGENRKKGRRGEEKLVVSTLSSPPTLDVSAPPLETAHSYDALPSPFSSEPHSSTSENHMPSSLFRNAKLWRKGEGAGGAGGDLTPPPSPLSTDYEGGSNGSSIFQRSHSAGNIACGSPSGFSAACRSSIPNDRINAAFCLSPRNLRTEDSFSGGSARENQEGQRQLMPLLLDIDVPQQKEYCDVSSPEERQRFLYYRCIELLSHMTPAAVVRYLLPVIVACLENDDQYHDQAAENSVDLVSKCLPLVFDVVRPVEDLSMFAAFLMPIMQLCTAVDRRTVPIVTNCLIRITEKMPEKGIERLLVPFLEKLRYSSCSLFRAIAAGWMHAIPDALRSASWRSETRTWFSYFQQSVQDPNPIVREACVGAIARWVKVAISHGISPNELPLPILESLMTDDFSDVVRFLLVDQLAEIGALLGKADTSQVLLPLFEAALKGKSWRVRYRAACQLWPFSSLLRTPDETVLAAMSRLSKDDEVEIRAVVASEIGDFVSLVSMPAGKQKLWRIALRLADDNSRHVQLYMIANLAPFAAIDEEVAGEVSRILSSAMKKDDPPLQVYAIGSVCSTINILRRANVVGACGEYQSTSTVRSNRLRGSAGDTSGDQPGSSSGIPSSSFSPAVQNILQTFVDDLTQLSDSITWRVREAVLSSIPHLASVLPPETFPALHPTITQLLLDRVCRVRETAAKTLRGVAKWAGAPWAAKMLYELLTGKLGTTLQDTYGCRVLTIRCLNALLPTAALIDARHPRRQVLQSRTLQLLHDYSNDKVPIVKTFLADSIVHWRSWFNSFSGDTIRTGTSGTNGRANSSGNAKRLVNSLSSRRTGNSTPRPESSSEKMSEAQVVEFFKTVEKMLKPQRLVPPPQLTTR